jgi:putative NIF3 family GTP cyclohydrolase 1 type 2
MSIASRAASSSGWDRWCRGGAVDLDSGAIGAATVSALGRRSVDPEGRRCPVERADRGRVQSRRSIRPVTGIVTTSLATIDVMRRAVKAGANLIITAGPTFYSRADTPRHRRARPRRAAPSAPDPVFTAKNEFIRANRSGRLALQRSLAAAHARIRSRKGSAEALGGHDTPDQRRPVAADRAAVTLEALAARVKSRLDARGGVRVVGRQQTRVRTIGLLPGTRSIQEMVALLPQVDAVIAGEIREWESSEYARDVVNAGLGKALILVGRSLSEDAGMRVCADWLRTIVPEAPVRWLPAGDPYWRPTA